MSASYRFLTVLLLQLRPDVVPKTAGKITLRTAVTVPVTLNVSPTSPAVAAGELRRTPVESQCIAQYIDAAKHVTIVSTQHSVNSHTKRRRDARTDDGTVSLGRRAGIGP